MVQFAKLDERVSVLEQMQDDDGGAVVLVNVFTVDAGDEAAMLDCWAQDAAFMKAQPGFISTQLHRGVGTVPTYLNYAVWEDVEAFRTAFGQPGFQAQLGNYPASAVSRPQLFRSVAVPGICVGA